MKTWEGFVLRPLKLSDLDYLLNNGSDEELILINYLTYFARILNKYT